MFIKICYLSLSRNIVLLFNHGFYYADKPHIFFFLSHSLLCLKFMFFGKIFFNCKTTLKDFFFLTFLVQHLKLCKRTISFVVNFVIVSHFYLNFCTIEYPQHSKIVIMLKKYAKHKYLTQNNVVIKVTTATKNQQVSSNVVFL